MDAETVIVGFLGGVVGALLVRGIYQHRESSLPAAAPKTPVLLSRGGGMNGAKPRLGYI